MPNIDARYGPVLADHLRIMVTIEYESADGETTQREIRVEKLHGRVLANPPAFDLDYIRAWCYERDAFRTFRTDRIRALIDPLTGEIVPDPEHWLCRSARLTEIASAEHVARFTGAESTPVAELRVTLLWQRAPGLTESYVADIDEVHRRAGRIVGFRARAQRIPTPTAQRWQGDKTFDLDVTDGDGILALEFDSILYEDPDEIAAWLDAMRPLR